MYHAVWKLTALAAVVAVGVIVVIQAQRGMHENDPGTGKAVATGLERDGAGGETKDVFDETELPVQGEPDMADDLSGDTRAVPAAARTNRSGAAVSAIPTEEARLGLNETRGNDDPPTPVRKAAVGSDPFGDLDADVATDDEPAPAAKTKPAKADPFEDENEIPAAPAKAGGSAKSTDEDDDDELLKDLDTPPAALPRAALGSKPKPVARDPFKEDAADDELPALPDEDELRPAPVRKPVAPPFPKDALPKDALPKDAVPKELDDADEQPPEPRRAVKPLLPDNDAESTPREIEIPPQRRTGHPALPQLDEPVFEEESGPPPKPELPKLTIDKVAPPTAVLGRPMVYQIVVRNTGDIPAHQVVVEDAVPEGLKIDGSIPQAQLKENHLIWKLGTIPAGREKKISVRVIPQSEGAIGSVATLNFSPVPPPPANPAAPQLTFKVDAPRQAAVGTPVDFRFRISNIGSVPATGVTIRDVLPAGLHHADGDDLEYEIGKIAPGKTSEVKLTLTAAQAGPTVNRVVVTADGNVSEAAEVQLDVVAPTLAVSRGGSRQLYPGKIGRFTNTVTNSGAGHVSKINVVEIVPAGMEFVEASDGGSYNAAKRTVTWGIDRLATGDSKTVKVSLRSAARGPQISVVRASDNGGTSAETVGTTVVAGVPVLKIEVGDLPPLVDVGETVKIRVRIVNRGTDVATGVRTSIPIPSGLKFLSATGPVEYRQAPVAGEEGAPRSMEIQFAPIGTIDTKGEVAFELTFKGRAPGETHLEVHAQCDQMTETIHSRDALMIALPE